MDKVTRMLILYSSLINGEEINKTIFCFENDCSPRSFDRDIEDIRLFLSESFSLEELNYNRSNNTYYIKGANRQQLEAMEYLFVEKILLDTSVLRNDEIDVLKQHLLMNTRDSSKIVTALNKEHIPYKSPEHNKALLKMHGDLEMAIRNQKYIRLVYQDDVGISNICDLIPCVIRYKSGHLYFAGLIENIIFNIDLGRIYSFEILRGQTSAERERVEVYMRTDTQNTFSELNNNLVEVVLECTCDDYKILNSVFDNSEVLRQENKWLRIRTVGSEDDFINWYLAYSTETVTIIEPQYIKEKLVLQAQKIIKKYGGKD